MYHISVDIGGTHTDIVLTDDQRNIWDCKVATTPEDPSIGVMNSCIKVARDFNISLDQLLGQIDLFIHSGTVVSNTLIQEAGAKVGTVVTDGFHDILEIRRGRRETGFNFMVEFPAMLSPRELRVGVKERISFTGEVVTPLNEDDVRSAAARFKKHGVESVAVTFLHSYANPSHERRAAEIIAEEMPNVPILLSSDVLPLAGEFERFSTTTVDAYVAPQLLGYLSRLDKRLKDNGFKGRLFIAQCSGGVAALEVARKRAVWSMNSGPCSGPLAADYYGKLIDSNKIIAIDAGGTSFDVSLVVDGEIFVTTDGWVSDQRIAVPMVDVESMGAGGGSIAWINPAGVLQVGPKSAGADPGPCCYGKGGEEPTLTDADLVLGYLNPDYFLGGEMKLDVDLAEKAIKDKIASALGKDISEAANSIVKVTEANMATSTRKMVTKRGHDPREFSLIAAGGSGPVHAASIAKELEIPQLLIPKRAGSFCAFGWLISDIRHDFIRSRLMYLETPEMAELTVSNSLFYEMLDEARRLGLDIKRAIIKKTIDIRYAGQFRDVEIDVPTSEELSQEHVAEIVKAFDEKHEKLYAFSMPGLPVEFVNFRTKVFIPLPTPEVKKQKFAGSDASPALVSQRNCFFDGRFVETSIYDGDKLLPGNIIKGPAVIELVTTTVVIPPEFTCTVNEFGDYLLKYRS